MTTPEESEKLQKLRELRRLQIAARRKILDERFPEVVQYEESEAERHQRIMDDPTAWNKL